MTGAILFLDTSYAIALASKRDAHHERAFELSLEIERNGTGLVTTQAILLELGNALAAQRHRQASIRLLDSLETDPVVEIVPISESLYQAALRLYRARPDKNWGLVDCMSFIVMTQKRITDALTADDHFRQAGFNALLQN